MFRRSYPHRAATRFAAVLLAGALAADAPADSSAADSSADAATSGRPIAPVSNAVTITTPGRSYDVSGTLRPGIGSITLVNTDDVAHRDYTDEMPGLANPIGIAWVPIGVAEQVSWIAVSVSVLLAAASLGLRWWRGACPSGSRDHIGLGGGGDLRPVGGAAPAALLRGRFAKLQVADRTQAIVRARSAGLGESAPS